MPSHLKKYTTDAAWLPMGYGEVPAGAREPEPPAAAVSSASDQLSKNRPLITDDCRCFQLPITSIGTSIVWGGRH
jgi:hypothetical protein